MIINIVDPQRYIKCKDGTEVATFLLNTTSTLRRITQKQKPRLRHVHHVLDGVYISGANATRHAAALHEDGLRYVLKLYGGEPYFPLTFKTLEVPVRDGHALPPEKLKVGVAFIHKLVDSGNPVLVMCGQGISRSSTFILAYMIERGYDLRDAFHYLFYQHPDAEPHSQMWLSLIKQYRLSYSLRTVMSWPFSD